MMSLNEYFAKLTPEQSLVMNKIRELGRALVPKAEEVMGYGVPSFKLKGRPVFYYAAFKEHVGIYPASDEIIKIIPELAIYRAGKGTFKFPLSEPIPYSLIEKFVRVKIDSSQKL